MPTETLEALNRVANHIFLQVCEEVCLNGEWREFYDDGLDFVEKLIDED